MNSSTCASAATRAAAETCDPGASMTGTHTTSGWGQARAWLMGPVTIGHSACDDLVHFRRSPRVRRNSIGDSRWLAVSHLLEPPVCDPCGRTLGTGYETLVEEPLRLAALSRPQACAGAARMAACGSTKSDTALRRSSENRPER